MVLGGGAFGKWLELDEVTGTPLSWMGLVPLWESPKSLLLLSALLPWGYEKLAVWSLEKHSLQNRTLPAPWSPTPSLQSLSKFLWFISHPVCGTLFEQPQLIKIVLEIKIYAHLSLSFRLLPTWIFISQGPALETFISDLSLRNGPFTVHLPLRTVLIFPSIFLK